MRAPMSMNVFGMRRRGRRALKLTMLMICYSGVYIPRQSLSYPGGQMALPPAEVHHEQLNPNA
jgi:hypothetical protein